ncbi:hypothetical protein FRC07_012185, partial [Ceratobasidium sp. 392]
MWLREEEGEGDAGDDEMWSFKMAIQRSGIQGRLSLMRYMRFAIHIYLMHHLQPSDRLRDLVTQAKKILLDEIVVASMTDVLDSLESKGVLGQSEAMLVLGAWLTQPVLYECLNSFMASQLEPFVMGILKAQKAYLHVSSVTTDSSSSVKESITVVEFQENYIQLRINAHAKRIAAHQLGDAAIVCEDLNSTMTEVWRSMPVSFGAVRGEADG